MAEFNVVQTSGGIRNEIGEMSEMQVYSHVRTRLGNDMDAAENVLIELEEKGAATVLFNDGLGRENRLDIRRTT